MRSPAAKCAPLTFAGDVDTRRRVEELVVPQAAAADVARAARIATPTSRRIIF
jgi:hypothetical protein